MLRTDRNAGFVTEGAWFWKRHRFRAARLAAARALGPRALAELEQLQREQPVALIEAVVERQRRKQRKLERAHAAMQQELTGSPRREPILRDVRLAVWRRDGGRCVECDSDFELQYDHVIPFSMGGASSVENLQLLCADCNRAKGAAL